MLRARRLVLGALFVCLPAAAGAQGGTTPPPNPDAQSIRIGTQIFYDYTYTAAPKGTDADGNEISPNSFNIQRAYINVIGTISRAVSFRVTPDVRRETGTGSSLNGAMTFRLKYAYAQFALDEWMADGTIARLGMIQTPYLESIDGIYRYRFQGTTITERDAGFISADVGASFRMPVGGEYGEVQVGFYNGEGYQAVEPNDQKSLQLLGMLLPLVKSSGALRGLRLTAFYNGDHYQKNAERRRFATNAMLEHRRFNGGFEFVSGTDLKSATGASLDSDGYSFFFTPFLNEKGRGWEGLLRYDWYDEDAESAGHRDRWIGGIAYWFPHPAGSATAALLLDYEQVNFREYPAGLKPPTQRRIALHGLINF